MLIIDNSDVWWFRGTKTDHDRRLANDALEVFRIICKHAETALWEGFAIEQIKRVSVTTPMQKPFFSQPYFERWLNEASSEFKRWFQAEENFLERAIKPDSIVLDVGCGFGRHMEILAKKCKKVVGIDINPTMIQKASNRLLPKYWGKIEVWLANAVDLPFPNDSFDYVICMTNTFGNITEDRRRVLSEMKRVLKPGGKLIISVYNDSEEVLKGRVKDYEKIGLTIKKIENKTVYTVEGLISKQFSREELIDMCNEADLEISINNLDSVGLIVEATKKKT